MEIINKVLQHINKNNLLKHGDSVICAVSGGADSVCMLDILVQLKEMFSLNLYVAHLNHCLRGDEADRDEMYVKELCKNYDLPFYSKSTDVNCLSKEQKISCEEAGRNARYAFFDELKKITGATKIATAHNKNDNIETVLMRIIRGTDIKGLAGIPAENNGIIRPVLCLSRDEIEAYIQCKGLDFVIDSTNSENNFTRNKIRNILIPSIINDYNQSFNDTFSTSIEVFKEAENFIDDYAFEKFTILAQKEVFGYSFEIPTLLKENVYIVKRIIKKAIFDMCYSSITGSMCEKLYSALSFEDTAISVNKEIDFFVKYNTAYIVKKHNLNKFTYKLQSCGKHYIPELALTVEITENNDRIFFNDKNTIFLDTNKVSCDFVLRSRNTGDKMSINSGTKKIKDILIDEKIPHFLRDEIPVLEYNGKIVWLCGVRDDTRFRADKNTNGLKITLHKEKNDA